MKLCKYCDENGVDIIKNKRLKIASIDDFNDPFEFRFAYEGTNKELEEAFKNVHEYQKHNYRVISFSKDSNNLILWAHYANKHKGILIKFDLNEMKQDGTSFNETTIKVNYTHERIKFSADFDLKVNENKALDLFKKINYTKFKKWKYEDEYRTIIKFDFKENIPYIPILPKSIKEIVLGLNCSWKTELIVKSLLKDMDYKHVLLKKAEIDDYKFKMKYIPIEL